MSALVNGDEYVQQTSAVALVPSQLVLVEQESVFKAVEVRWPKASRISGQVVPA